MKRFCKKQGRTKGIKDFISVLILYQSHSAEDIETAVAQALTAGVGTSEAVEHILLRSKRSIGDVHFRRLDNWQVFAPADVSIYEQIGGGI